MNTSLIREELFVEVSQTNQRVHTCILHRDDVDTQAKIKELIVYWSKVFPGHKVAVYRTVSLTEELGAS